MKISNFILPIIIVTIAFFSRPSLSDHQAAINDDFKKNNRLLGTLGAGKLAAALPKYHDLYIMSITTIDDNIASLGFFTRVLVVVNTDIDV